MVNCASLSLGRWAASTGTAVGGLLRSPCCTRLALCPPIPRFPGLWGVEAGQDPDTQPLCFLLSAGTAAP